MHICNIPKAIPLLVQLTEFLLLQQLETEGAAAPSLLCESRPEENAAFNVSAVPWITGCAQQLAIPTPLICIWS